MRTFPTLLEWLAVAACMAGCSDDQSANRDAGDAGVASDGSNEDAGADLAPVDEGSVTISAAARTYCECMLINCHEPFHAYWGEDDADAIAACEVDASGLPVTGSAQMSGNSIECRQFQCENAADDSQCAGALGDACQ